jgi:signal transduction histidine kinase
MKKLWVVCLLWSLTAMSQKTAVLKGRSINDKAMALYQVNPDKAQQLLKEAETLANETYDADLIAETQNNMAILQRMKGEFMESKSRSLKVIKMAKDDKVKASIYNNLGACDRSLGKYNESLQYYLKALKIYEDKHVIKSQATVNNNIGMVFSTLEQLDKAKKYHKKAMELFASINNKKGLSESYNNYAIALATQDSLPLAMSFFRKSLKIEEGLADKKGIAESLNNVGSVYYYIGTVDSALFYFEKSAQIELELHNLIGAAESYNNIAQVYIETKKMDKAKKFIDKAFIYAKKTKTVENILTSLDNYKLYYESLGNYAEANKKIIAFYALKDSIQKVNRIKDLNELETKYQTAKKEKLLLQKEAENKRKSTWLLIISLFAIFIGITGYLIYHQQKLKNKQLNQEFELKSAIAKIETQNKLQEQRLQISRDLHDNIGSQLTFIISSVDNIKYAFEVQNEKLDQKLSSISSFAKSTIIELRDTIWAMNKSEITFEDLQTRIHNFMDKAKEAKEGIRFGFEMESKYKDIKFTSVEGMNIYRTIQEAINNSIKYAEASKINVVISKNEEVITITVSDNGIGFNKDEVVLGNGISNMKKRITDIKGTFEMYSKVKEGTRIKITIEINS